MKIKKEKKFLSHAKFRVAHNNDYKLREVEKFWDYF